MIRRQLLPAAALPLAWRVAPDVLASRAFAATASKEEKPNMLTHRT